MQIVIGAIGFLTEKFSLKGTEGEKRFGPDLLSDDPSGAKSLNNP